MNYETPEVQTMTSIWNSLVETGRDPLLVDSSVVEYYQDLLLQRGQEFADEVYNTMINNIRDNYPPKDPYTAEVLELIPTENEEIMMDEELMLPTPDNFNDPTYRHQHLCNIEKEK